MNFTLDRHLCLFSAALCVRFAQPTYMVGDNGGMVTVEVELCNVIEPTQTEVWLELMASEGMLATSA